jgi:hypothetical protein
LDTGLFLGIKQFVEINEITRKTSEGLQPQKEVIEGSIAS